MVQRSPIKLLAASAFAGIALLYCVARLFVGGDSVYAPGATNEYHPAATLELQLASSTLDDLGWTGENAQGTPLFVPEVHDGEALALETRLSHRTIDSTKTSPVEAAIAIRAREGSAGERAPLNLALVIDRSGSMFGGKIDDAKAAAHALVDALGPRDQLAIVTYGSEVTTASPTRRVTTQNAAGLHAAIRAIGCGGGTNLSGGFERGRDLVRAAHHDESIDRVILLSDGQANEGIVGIDELGRLASQALERNVSSTTMGVGLDYDENVLQRMATSGAGNYYFIENSDATARVLQTELQTLASAVARGTSLRLVLAPGVELVQLRGFAHQVERSLVVVPLDAFGAGQQKDLLVELVVKPWVGDSRRVLETVLYYTDVEAGEPAALGDTATVGASSGVVEADPVIMRRVQQIRTAEALADAMDIYDRGDRFEAADLLDKQREANLAFVSTHAIKDPAFRRVDEELGNLAEALRKTERHTSEGRWISKSGKFRSGSIVTDSIVF